MKISIQHDGTFDIATGRSRKETNWKNREMSWKDMVQKLSVTHRTAETYTEYVASKKPRQDEIKDIGGFVGGYLSSGRRKAGSVMHRQLITLDIDFAKGDIWDDFTLIYGNAACIYSTHKHSPDSPRYRLILPLDRTVRADEYEAIARRIAGIIGIDYFDHTTYQPSRLMYWPSTSKDGTYYFNYQDGEWLSADEILSSYRDWTDSSEWPVSTRESAVIKKGILKQGDPLEKPGVVGAFCRTYTIHEAIENFLSDVYEPCDVEDRYTFKEGSTAAGLVIYDDKYAYSHHGTDPISGKLCNAFDLVRIHKYGLKDEDVREGTPGNKLPSYTAMMDFATKDARVRKLIVSQRLDEAKEGFADYEDFVEDDNDEWKEKLKVDRKGAVQGTINNVAIILENDPRLKGCFATDEFRRKKLVLRNLPWRKITEDTKYIKDEDEQNLVKYLERWYDITTRSNIKDAFDTHLEAHGFHPVRDYLQSLVWDGEERVDTLLIDYLGADDSEYIKAVTRKTLVAAVARVHQPGVKFDNVLTLVGPQGIGKSSIIGKLGRTWFSDSFHFNMLHTKEAYEQIQGAWLIEIGELAGMRKADVEAAKQFITKREDSFRVAYGRNISTFKRQCVFFGSTNNRDFLRDPSGNRRFWPVDTMQQKPVKNIFTDLKDVEIDQMWAEAVVLYKAGEPLHLSEKLEEEAYARQVEHSEQDGRVGLIQKYLNTLLPIDWEDLEIYARRAFLAGDELQKEGVVQRDRVCAAEIWCEVLKGDPKDMDRVKTKEVHDIMRNMDGWKEHYTKMKFKKYGVQKAYVRTESTATDDINKVSEVATKLLQKH